MIEIKNLSFSYPDLTVFRDVDLTIKSGEFVAIVGSNGSGKSTLLNLMLGFLRPQSGSIKLLGQPIDAFDQYSKIGTVFQGGLTRSQGFPATALEVVMLKAKRMNKQARIDAMTSLDHVGLKEIAHKKISKLSGGQLQRVYIARELMYEPSILFLDEPTTGLDKQSEEDLMNVLEHLNTVHKMTIIMVTHHHKDGNYRVLEVAEESILEKKVMKNV